MHTLCKTFHGRHAFALCSPTIQITLHACQHALHTTPLPSKTLLCTQQMQGIVGKMAQNVEIVWKYCGIIPVFVWLVFESSIPTCACFDSEYSFVTL